MLDLLNFTAIGERLASFITLFSDLIMVITITLVLVVGFFVLSVFLAEKKDKVEDRIIEPSWVLKNELARLWRLWRKINFSPKFFTGRRLLSLKNIAKSFMWRMVNLSLLISIVIAFLSVPLCPIAFISFCFRNPEKISIHYQFLRDLEVMKNFQEKNGYIVYAESGRKIDFIGTDDKIHTITISIPPRRITTYITEPETIGVHRSYVVIKGRNLSEPTLVTCYIN